MKKPALFLSLCALLAACDTGYKPDGPDQARSEKEAVAPSSDGTAGANEATVAQPPLANAGAAQSVPAGRPLAPGAKLIAGSDCLGCHKEQVKLVGPSYVAVAQKYPATEANIAMLTGRIIKGGVGHWGEVPMSAHPALAEADAREMVKYILTLK